MSTGTSETLEHRETEFDFLNINGLEGLSLGAVTSFEVPEERIFPRERDVLLRGPKGDLVGRARVLEFYGLNNLTIGKYKVTEVYAH